MASRLPKHLQIRALKSRFKKLNPLADIQAIDFTATVGKREGFTESLEGMKTQYPQYTWIKKRDPYEGMVIEDLRTQAKPYRYDIVKMSQLRKLGKVSEKVVYRDRVKYHDRVKTVNKVVYRNKSKFITRLSPHARSVVLNVKNTKKGTTVFVHESNRPWPSKHRRR
jgi:hypothetical protein